MKRALRVMAVVLALAVLGAWLARGANRGWTKTTETLLVKDPVTEIEYPAVQKRFVPGVEFLSAGLLVSLVLFGISFVVRERKP